MPLQSQASVVSAAWLGFLTETMSSRPASGRRAAAAPQAPERADGARGDSLGAPDLPRRDLAACGHLEADGVARAAVAARRGARARGDEPTGRAELRRRLLRAGPGGGARARPRPRRALPARRDLRPARRRAGAAGRRARRQRRGRARSTQIVDAPRRLAGRGGRARRRRSSTASSSASPASSTRRRRGIALATQRRGARGRRVRQRARARASTSR